MSRKTISLEIELGHEVLLRQYAAFLEEMDQLAATAPEGIVLNACEEAVVERGREQQRRVLERAVQARLDAVEKKGPRSGGVRADRPARIVDPPRATSAPASGRSGCDGGGGVRDAAARPADITPTPWSGSTAASAPASSARPADWPPTSRLR